MSDYEQLENTAEWLWELYHEFDGEELEIHKHIEMLRLSLQNPDYNDVSRKMIGNEIDALMDMVIVDADWASMPADDEGAKAEELISNLRGYGITFSPALPGYYFVQRLGGVRYEVRSSFATEGKSLGSILEKVIVDRAASDCQRDK